MDGRPDLSRPVHEVVDALGKPLALEQANGDAHLAADAPTGGSAIGLRSYFERII
jgi:hypothetical protein